MAAVAFTKIVSTDNQIVYSWTGDVAGDLAYATLAADVGTTSTLGRIIASLAGQCGTDAKAVAALQTGASFVGTVSGAAIVTNIQCDLVYTLSTATKYPGFINAIDDGGTNSPKLTLTAEANSSGFLYITHVFSAIQ
jgi:hypothetical protein